MAAIFIAESYCYGIFHFGHPIWRYDTNYIYTEGHGPMEIKIYTFVRHPRAVYRDFCFVDAKHYIVALLTEKSKMFFFKILKF